MPLTPAEKTRRHRLRQSGELPALPVCPDCGRSVISSRTLPLCSRCWRRSPAGRVTDAERKRRVRKRDDL